MKNLFGEIQLSRTENLKVESFGEQGSAAVILMVLFAVIFVVMSVSGALNGQIGYQMNALNNLRYQDDRMDISNRVQFLLNRRSTCQTALKDLPIPSQQSPTFLQTLNYPSDAYIFPNQGSSRILLMPNLVYGFQKIGSIQLEFINRIALNAQSTLFSSSILARLHVRFNDVAFRDTRGFSVPLYLTPVGGNNSVGSCFATVLNSNGQTLEDTTCFNSKGANQTAAVFNPDFLRCVRW